MTRTWQLILQLLGAFLQMVVTQIPSIEPGWIPVVHGAIGFCQMAVAIIGHSYNSDGTPETMPYQPPTKVATPAGVSVTVTAEPVVPPVVEPVAKESK